MSEELNIEFKDDKFVQIDDEFEQIQTFTGMYMSATGEHGALHMAKEVINNSIDELTNPECASIENKKIDIMVDETSNEYIIADNGRGVPFDVIVPSLTKKHGSTKIGRTVNRYSAGQNGIGLKLTVALSDYFSMVTYRGNEYKIVEFNQCNINEHAPEKNKKNKHGTVVKFRPSEKYLGKIDVKSELVEDWVRRLSYLIPEGITMKFVGIKKGSEGSINKKFMHKTLIDNVEYLSPSLEFNPILIESNEVTYKDENDLENNMIAKFAFSYDKNIDGELIDGYCNYVHNVDGGYHIDACKRALCDFLVKESKKADPNNKYEIISDDCKKGLIMAVNFMHTNPCFGGQSKDKVENKSILKEGRALISKELKKYFDNNNALLKKIINYLRQVAKVRLQSNKIRGITAKKSTTFLEDAEIQGFYNISDRNYSGYTELYITEGDSASGAVLNVRNPKFQAVLSIFGVIDNTIGMNINHAMQKQTIKNLIRVLGCGIGSSFDITKLRWNRIIIETDADIDGHNITSNLSAFFCDHMPELVEGGFIYKSVPPLYLFKEKTIKKYGIKGHLFEKKDYFKLYDEIIAKNVEIMYDPKSDKFIDSGLHDPIMSKKEKLHWLELNKDYLTALKKIIKRTGYDELNEYFFIIEKICMTLLDVIMRYGDENYDFIEVLTLFKELIESKFNELKFDLEDQVLEGSYKGLPIAIIIDNLFMKNASELLEILSKNISYNVGLKKKDSNDDFAIYTIGQALLLLDNKFTLDIDQRFKGLGEIESELMFKTVLNPLYRRLIKLTMDDKNKVMETVYLLHGKKNPDKRRELLDSIRITYDDIDN